ncbi:MAG: COR domain-containing protein, partial [Microcystaceae cyanobacterium]
MGQLEILCLSSNKITTIPEAISNLQNLAWLNLSANQISTIPESITHLENLTELDLSGNQISTIPESIIGLKNLTKLVLSWNKISTIPESITRLQNLTGLDLRNNQISTISESIIHLKNLTGLDLRNNQISTIPESIIRLKNLTRLDLSGNPIETPPLEIVEKGIEAIKEYFRQIEREGVDYLYEAKLLVIGEGGAGKTTLAKKIDNSDYQLREDEDSTKGIDVIKWHFPGENGKEFRVNIWDFGGQEIYHATHQFFLTKRSLYTLVADSRREDTDFYYWLNVVELLSDNSPLLIIKNEKQDRHREINETQLRGEFNNLKETLATNLATNRGLEDVLKAIKYNITRLPHIGSALPETWVKVRETLERDARDYISLDEYLMICQKNGFTQQKDKLQLSGYLHDLGVFLHFQDDPLLKHIVILKPAWGTDAVYQVLDNSIVIRNLGEFNKSDLEAIWHEVKYAHKQDELLQLMMKFKLCYKIPDSLDTYIAPQLLTLNQPEYIWDEVNNLLLRYTYEFMPKGILTQFI